jgi:hypothetical protein
MAFSELPFWAAKGRMNAKPFGLWEMKINLQDTASSGIGFFLNSCY